MRAFVLKEPGVVGYVDVPEPRLTPYGAILRPVAVAPCSSDVHTVFGGGSRKAPNLVLGHECVAEVLEVGELVEEFRPVRSWQFRRLPLTGGTGVSRSVILSMPVPRFPVTSWAEASQVSLQRSF